MELFTISMATEPFLSPDVNMLVFWQLYVGAVDRSQTEAATFPRANAS